MISGAGKKTVAKNTKTVNVEVKSTGNSTKNKTAKLAPKSLAKTVTAADDLNTIADAGKDVKIPITDSTAEKHFGIGNDLPIFLM